jgi:riboflavin kinase/FMN adenylyltransferase
VRIYKDLFDPNLGGLEGGSYITIGSFDGVHQGHQQLISTVVREGRKHNCPTIVITFDPLPKEYFGHIESRSIRLSSSRTRAERIASIGVDVLLEYSFDQSFSEISADEFIDRIIKKLHPKTVFIGSDFKFGYKGLGDASFLKQKGSDCHFETEILEFVDLDQERISSSRVRNAIQDGELELASHLMGRDHEIRGRIIRGIQGNHVFFVPHSEVVIPPSGVYKVTLNNTNKKHVTKAKIVEANRSIEVDLDKQLVNLFSKDEVLFQFTHSVPEISEFEEEQAWKRNSYYRSI